MKPDLTGSRIVLRTIYPQDAADLFEIYGNPLTMEFASDPCFTSPAMVAQMMASVVRLEQTGEALGLLFAHASTLGVTCLTADIDADNVRSIALFEKLGFKAHAGRYQRMLPFV